MKRSAPLLPALATALLLGLIPALGGCRHGSPTPEAAAEAEAKPESDDAPDTSTLSGRLQKLGQEIEAIPENTARRMGPELETLETKRVELGAKLRQEGKVIGKRMKIAIDSLEDDLRIMRSRLTGPPPATQAEPLPDAPEDPAEETDPSSE